MNFDRFNGRTRGFVLEGRPELVSTVDEILKPIASWDVGHHSSSAILESDDVNFLLEGVPTLVADQDQQAGVAHYHASTDTLDKVDFATLRHARYCDLVSVGERPARAPMKLRNGCSASVRKSTRRRLAGVRDDFRNWLMHTA